MKDKMLTDLRKSAYVNRIYTAHASAYAYSDGPIRYQETTKDLQAKIRKITMMIKEQFPEKAKFIDDMPTASLEAMTDENEQNITQLRIYYDSLHAIHIKYKLEEDFRLK